MTIFASRESGSKAICSGHAHAIAAMHHNIVWATPFCKLDWSWQYELQKLHNFTILIRESFYPLKFPAIRYSVSFCLWKRKISGSKEQLLKNYLWCKDSYSYIHAYIHTYIHTCIAPTSLKSRDIEWILGMEWNDTDHPNSGMSWSDPVQEKQVVMYLFYFCILSWWPKDIVCQIVCCIIRCYTLFMLAQTLQVEKSLDQGVAKELQKFPHTPVIQITLWKWNWVAWSQELS